MSRETLRKWMAERGIWIAWHSLFSISYSLHLCLPLTMVLTRAFISANFRHDDLAKAMTKRTFADELENAANRIDEFSQSDLQALLRRAALRFRNSVGLPLERDSDDILASIAAGIGMQKAELIRRLLREWLEDNGYLPRSHWFRQIDDRTSLPPEDF